MLLGQGGHAKHATDTGFPVRHLARRQVQQRALRQRFKEPLPAFEGSRCDVVRRRIAGEVPLLQEVDIESSAEITLDARVTLLSVHEKNRCVPRYEAVGSFGGISWAARGAAGTISGTVLGTAGFPQLEASRILRVLNAVRWPRG
jgi:hypothetical protein